MQCPLRVLVVDDEPALRLGIAGTLECFRVQLPDEGEVGFTVEVADSGEAALAQIARRPPDLLLLDLKLPGLSGLEVLEQLASQGREVLTLLVTGYATLDVAVAATKRGAFDVLAKPFEPGALRAAVAKACAHLALERQARAHADEKRRLRMEVFGVLAHELKAPIAAVEGYLLALDERALGQELGAYDPMVKRSLIRLREMRQLVVDLLDLSRLGSSQAGRETETLDLVAEAQKAMERVRPEAEARHVALELRAPLSLPLEGNRQECDLVLNNLLSNAVKYNRDGGQVLVSIESAHGSVALRVRDSGIGMSAEESRRIFQEFVRIKNEKTRKISGTGLGLAIVRKVVERYGGQVRVASQPDVGSTFEVLLPLSTEGLRRELEPGEAAHAMGRP